MKNLYKIVLTLVILLWSGAFLFSQSVDLQIPAVSAVPYKLGKCEKGTLYVSVYNGDPVTDITTGQVRIHVTVSGEILLPEVITGYNPIDGNGNVFEVTYTNFSNNKTEIVLKNTLGDLSALQGYNIELPFVGETPTPGNDASAIANGDYVIGSSYYDPQQNNNSADAYLDVDSMPSYQVTYNTVPVVNGGTVVACEGSAAAVQLTGTPGGTFVMTHEGVTVGIGNVNDPAYNFTVALSDSGDYELTVTSQYNCVQIFNYKLQVNPLPTFDLTVNGTAIADGDTYTVCEGNSVTVQIANAAPSGTYDLIFNGTLIQDDAPFINGSYSFTAALTDDGTYQYIVTTGDGCSSTFTYELQVNPLPTFDLTVNGTAIADGDTYTVCEGNSVTVQIANAAPSGTYDLIFNGTLIQDDAPFINGSYSFTAALTDDGTYQYIVTTGDGCSSTFTYDLQVNPLPSATISYAQSQFCAIGTATVTIVGQTGGTFSSTSGIALNTTTGEIDLGASTPGSYVITYNFSDPVTLCTNSTTTTVEIVPQPTISVVNIQDVGCNGGSDGSAEVLASGGTGTLDYLWSNGEVTPLITGLTAGTYTVTTTDDNGCNTSTSVTISEPPVLDIVNYIITNETCQSCDNGSITINATGGTSPYEYSIDGGMTWQVSNYFSGLMAGTYMAVVKDAHGCQTVPEAVIVTEPGVYPDLTPQHFASISNLSVGNTSTIVVRIRNVGTGSTTGLFTFSLSKFISASGLSLTVLNQPSVTILGTPYSLDYDDFNIVDMGLFYVFTSKPGVVIPDGGYLQIGLELTRTGGNFGSVNLTTSIYNNSGGETNNLNNSLVSTFYKN
ncbi:MAG: SprB repeat-containing protein [Saprospiraceae bacterium]|nr:SprB repeat-containing protein [Saprospiraceae bacterium]